MSARCWWRRPRSRSPRRSRQHGGDAIVTDPALPSGSDRIAEALSLRDPQGRFSFVVNLQGDLPTIDPLSIQRCLAGLVNEQADISTIAARIEDRGGCRQSQYREGDRTAVGDEREVAFARDFLRQVGPDHPPPYLAPHRRLCLSPPGPRAFRVPARQSEREAERKLEQMRALDNGMRIVVVRVDTVPLGVDTPAELETARRMLRKTA